MRVRDPQTEALIERLVRRGHSNGFIAEQTGHTPNSIAVIIGHKRWTYPGKRASGYKGTKPRPAIPASKVFDYIALRDNNQYRLNEILDMLEIDRSII